METLSPRLRDLLQISDYLTFSPEDAEEIITHCRYERQRKVVTSHVQRLKQRMEGGDWLEGAQLDFALVNGKLILVNGYHRLTAQSQTAMEIIWQCNVRPVEDEDQVADMYAKLDTVQRTRKISDVVRALGSDALPGVGDMGVYWASQFVRAIINLEKQLNPSIDFIEYSEAPLLWEKYQAKIVAAHSALTCNKAMSGVVKFAKSQTRLAIVVHTCNPKNDRTLEHWRNFARVTPDTWGAKVANYILNTSQNQTYARFEAASSKIQAFMLKSFVNHMIGKQGQYIKMAQRERVEWEGLAYVNLRPGTVIVLENDDEE